MKRFFLFTATVSLFLFSCGGRNQASVASDTAGTFQKVVELDLEKIRSAKDTIDFGRLSQGEMVEFRLGIRNADSQAMVILDILNACGCTSLDYEKRPVLAGDTALVRLLYDSKGQIGVQRKMIQIITSLDPKPFNIYLSAEVHK